MRHLKRRISLTIVALAISGCSTLGGLALDALSPSSKGIEATAQVGENNQKGLVNTTLESSNESSNKNDLELKDVQGDAVVDASTIFETNINIPVYYVLLVALGFWCVRTPWGLGIDFLKARGRLCRSERKQKENTS